MTPTESPAPKTLPPVLLYLTAALMPFSLNIGLHFTASKKDLYLSPLDVLAPLLFLLGLFYLLKSKSDTPLIQRAADSIPHANLIFACWALLSFIGSMSPGLSDWARNAVFQIGLSGFVAVWVFGNGLSKPALARKATLILSACIGLCFLYALYQYVQPEGKPVNSVEALATAGGVSNYRVAGWYDYRGQFGGQIAMLVPVFLALAALEKDPLLRIGALALGLAGLSVCLSGGGVIAACAGILVIVAGLSYTASSLPKRYGAALWIVGLVVFMALALPKLPRHNAEVLWRNLTLYAEVIEGDNKLEKPTARLRRHQASLNFLKVDGHWKTGAGSGNFQRAINQYYTEPYAKPSRNTDDETAWDMEADEKLSVGLWETIAVELGVPGVLLLGWVFATWLLAAASTLARLDAFSPEERDAAKLVALCSLGACAGAMVFSIWGNPLARGCAGSFALFMGAALALQRVSNRPAVSSVSGQ